MTHGNWDFLVDPSTLTNGGFGWYPDQPTVTVQCDYNYRGQPSWASQCGNVTRDTTLTQYGGATEYAGPYNADWEMRPMIIKFTKPAQTVYLGCPIFKTQKELGGRALVTDSFSRCSPISWDPYGRAFPLQPGKGYYAHRDGYNVLYGDWSAKWYGDLQQRIMWWPNVYDPYNTYSYANYSHMWCSQTNGVDWFAHPIAPTVFNGPDPAYDNETFGINTAVWHTFDTVARIDVQ